MAWDNLKDHLINAVAASALVGMGVAVVTDKVEIARHDERITRIEKLDDRMESLDKRLVETQVAIAEIKR